MNYISASTTIDPTATTSTTATTATTTTPTTPTDSAASTTPTGSTTPIGSTNPTGSTTPTTPIGSTTPKNLVQAKIHSVYCNCLNRCADKDGMNYWAGRYAANNGNMTDIVLGILYSSEYERKHMTGNLDQPATLYKHILLRNPDQSKLRFFSNLDQNPNFLNFDSTNFFLKKIAVLMV